MRPGDEITYIDIEGRLRRIVFIEALDGFVKWHRDEPPSRAGRFRTEDGYVIQIPFDAFEWAGEKGNIRSDIDCTGAPLDLP